MNNAQVSEVLQRTALVVDDEPLIVSFLADTLESFGFQVTTAETVSAAITAAEQNAPFSVAFVDLGLPDRSGLELMAELKQLQPKLPLVVASGYGYMAKREQVEDGAISAVLVKPYDASMIRKALSELGIAT